nr:MAG TPA: hypothetical protein [Caudoviricetes sp.]
MTSPLRLFIIQANRIAEGVLVCVPFSLCLVNVREGGFFMSFSNCLYYTIFSKRSKTNTRKSKNCASV